MKENGGERDNEIKFPGNHKNEEKPEDKTPKEKPTPEDLEGVIDLRKKIDERNKRGEGRFEGGNFYTYQQKQIESKIFLQIFQELEDILLKTPLSESEARKVAEYKKELIETYNDEQIRSWFLSSIKENREKDKALWLAMIFEATRRRIFI